MSIEKKSNKMKYVMERVSEKTFLLCALFSVISLLLIIGFVFWKGATPFLLKGYSFTEFLFGDVWVPSADQFGIAPMIMASLYATIGALIIGVPVGVLTAVFL